ncbi:LEA type 2 family protein [Bdellovibrio bacteriovorus]|uniref:LEA type 2 family protein n=1 Tax=Bdellovibrio bacteriovorus TaxID=959 RepID=UPI0035A90CEF
MKKSIYFLIFVLTVMVSCSSLTKNLLKDPEVSVVGLNVSEVTGQDALVNVKLNVKNPNPVPLRLGKVTYSLTVSGQDVTEGEFKDGIDIPSQGENAVVIPLRFKYNTVGNLVSGILKGTLSKEYELKGSAQMGLFSIPFTQKGELEF